MAASIHSVLIVVVFAHIALLAHVPRALGHVHISYSRQEIKYFWWSHVTARISLDLPTFLQMPRNMAQRHQTLFPRRTSGHAHQHGKKGSGSRDYPPPCWGKATIVCILVSHPPPACLASLAIITRAVTRRTHASMPLCYAVTNSILSTAICMWHTSFSCLMVCELHGVGSWRQLLVF